MEKMQAGTARSPGDTRFWFCLYDRPELQSLILEPSEDLQPLVEPLQTQGHFRLSGMILQNFPADLAFRRSAVGARAAGPAKHCNDLLGDSTVADVAAKDSVLILQKIHAVLDGVHAVTRVGIVAQGAEYAHGPSKITLTAVTVS